MRVELSDDVLIRELEGEAVLLNVESGRYFGLDQVATRMLALLRQSGSLEEVATILSEEYDAQPESIERDVREMIDRLVEQGLVKVCGLQR